VKEWGHPAPRQGRQSLDPAEDNLRIGFTSYCHIAPCFKPNATHNQGSRLDTSTSIQVLQTRSLTLLHTHYNVGLVRGQAF